MGTSRYAKRLELVDWRSTLMQSQLVAGAAILLACLATVSAEQTTDYQRPDGEPLLCYSCNSRSGLNSTVCENGTLVRMTAANSSWQTRCGTQHTSCMVQVYKTSITGNSSSALIERIWSVERQCAEDCDAGCLTVGERTKIIKCVSCCVEDLCNFADGAATVQQFQKALLWVSLWLVVK